MCMLGIEIEVVVLQCTKYDGKQTQYREVIGINNNYNFCCLRLFVVLYKLVNSV